MPENKNFEFTNYFTQTNKLVPKNYVEVTQEEGTQEPPKFEAQLFYPITKESGVIDQGRSYVADKANRGRWNATRTKNAEMQQRLFELGAYGEGANQDKVVDGLIGNQTRAALAKAEELGYMYDQNSNVFRKKPAQPKLVAKSRTVAQERMDTGAQRIANAFGSSRNNLTIPQVASQVMSGLKDMAVGALGQSRIGKLITDKQISMYDNMYPYSYGDVLVNDTTGEVTPYDGGEVPAGFRVRQTSANDDERVQGMSAFSKIRTSAQGKDPRRDYMEQMANLDLNTTEGRATWAKMVKEAPQGMVYLHINPQESQFLMRARLDQMNMYSGRPQQWDTYEINPDFESPTAKARGSSTYRIKDQNMRNLINGQMANYFLQHAKEGKWSEDGKAWILPNMGYMGNQTLIADDEKGTNLRYGDWWDYAIDAPQARRFYTADRLTEPGKTPVYQSKYGIGRNKAAMTESIDDLFKAIVDSYKDETKTAIARKKEQVTDIAQNYISRGINKVKSYFGNTFGINFSRNGGKLIPRNPNTY